MLNKVQLIGYLGHAPDIRQTKEGKGIAILSLATHSSWKHSSSDHSESAPSLREHLSSDHFENEHLSKEPSERTASEKFLAMNNKPEGESNLYLWEQKTEWHRVIVLRETLVTWIKEHLRKGDLVFVEGKLAYTERQDSTTSKQRVANIVVSGWEGTLKLIPSQKQASFKPFPLREVLGKSEEEGNQSLFQTTILGDPANDK